MQMTRAEILKQFKIWDNKISIFNPIRFGQWFLNEFHPTITAPVIFYCQNDRKALNMIVNDERFCSEVYG